MCAKRQSKKDSPRYGQKTSDDLRAYAKLLEAKYGEFLGFADAMEELGADCVELDGITKADRGIDLIDEFLAAVESKLVHVRRDKAKAGGVV